MTVYLGRHPTEEALTKEINEEECVINNVSGTFKLNHKYGQLLNEDPNCLSTKQPANMTLTTKRELTNEFAPLKKIIPDANSNNFTCVQGHATNPINTNYNPKIKINNFTFADSKLEAKFTYENLNSAVNKEMIKIFMRREKSSEALRLIERRDEITKPSNLRFRFDSSLK